MDLVHTRQLLPNRKVKLNFLCSLQTKKSNTEFCSTATYWSLASRSTSGIRCPVEFYWQTCWMFFHINKTFANPHFWIFKSNIVYIHVCKLALFFALIFAGALLRLFTCYHRQLSISGIAWDCQHSICVVSPACSWATRPAMTLVKNPQHNVDLQAI